MVTDKPSVIFVADPKLIERLDDWRFNNRFPSRAEAIRWLIEHGIKEWPKVDRKGG